MDSDFARYYNHATFLRDCQTNLEVSLQRSRATRVVSSLTMDNAYTPLPPDGRGLSGIERTRLQGDFRVKVGNVERKVGSTRLDMSLHEIMAEVYSISQSCERRQTRSR